MTGDLSPQTTLALLQAAGNDTVKNADKLKNMRDAQKLEEAAKDFEAMFISEMMKPMFEGIETNGPFGGGKGEEIFRSMLVQEYGKLLADTGQIGMADHVKSELIKMQEKIDGTTN